MASVEWWRLSIVFAILLEYSIIAALVDTSDDAYNSYRLDPPVVGTERFVFSPLESRRVRTRRSVLSPEIQPAPDAVTSSTPPAAPFNSKFLDAVGQLGRNVAEMEGRLATSEATEDKAKKKATAEVEEKNNKKATAEIEEKNNKKVAAEVEDKNNKKATAEVEEKNNKKATTEVEDKNNKKATTEAEDKTSKKATTEVDDKANKKATTEVDDKANKKSTAEVDDKSNKKATTDFEDKTSKKATSEPDAKSKKKANVEPGDKPLVPAGDPERPSTTETPDDGVQIASFPDDVNNKTLLQHNITNTSEDYHQYYNSTFTVNSPGAGLSYWVNMSDKQDAQVNQLLSQSHRRAATVKLSFDFPFYGHTVRNVTVATGGFLYTGEYIHSWLAATQYIAPLMANFDTSLSNDSFVKYIDTGTSFTVQWEKVLLQDRPSAGDFTFQVTLHQTGDIVFVYQNVPLVIESIQDDNHPVKVGLSDAYIIDRTIFFVRRKTIYEYHRVNFDRQDIKNWTVIYLTALTTCLTAKTCDDCMALPKGYSCNWCPGSQRCSNGMDRYRQEWLLKGCDRTSVATCPAPTPTAAPTQPAFSDKHSLTRQEDSGGSMTVPGIVGILSLVALVAGLAVWVLYSYRNPHTASGQLLIRYRPSTWSWRRGEARYTAATIHM